jgi:hypothetical protein
MDLLSWSVDSGELSPILIFMTSCLILFASFMSQSWLSSHSGYTQLLSFKVNSLFLLKTAKLKTSTIESFFIYFKIIKKRFIWQNYWCVHINCKWCEHTNVTTTINNNINLLRIRYDENIIDKLVKLVKFLK